MGWRCLINAPTAVIFLQKFVTSWSIYLQKILITFYCPSTTYGICMEMKSQCHFLPGLKPSQSLLTMMLTIHCYILEETCQAITTVTFEPCRALTISRAQCHLLYKLSQAAYYSRCTCSAHLKEARCDVRKGTYCIWVELPYTGQCLLHLN